MDSAANVANKINKRLSILIIDDNVVPLTLAVIRCLGVQGNVDIHVLNLNNLFLPSFRFSKYVKSYTRWCAINDNQVFTIIQETCLKVNADIIIPIKEKTIRIVAERLAGYKAFTHVPPMPELQTLEVVRNKWLLYNWLYNSKLVNDKPLKYTDVVQSGKIMQELAYPVLIKPFWGSGGRGIVLIRNSKELANFQPGKTLKPGELLIQNFIHGYDIDVSALTENGRILAYNIQKDISDNKKLAYSRSIEFFHHELLLEYASRIFKELNYSGIAHLDFRFDERELSFNLIDFNARFWTSLLGSLNTGINFPWHNCRQALNDSFTIPDFKSEKYFLTNNFIKILFTGISIRQTEFKYTLQDPVPFLVGLGYTVLYHLRKLIVRQQ